MQNLGKLRKSGQFLSFLIENITSAVFIVDKDYRIQSFNNTFQALFHKPEDKIIGVLCGDALGCVFTQNGKKDCGTTDHCDVCILRASVMKAFDEKSPTFKQKLLRKFFIQNKGVQKYFLYTSKYIDYEKENMVLVILDDITELEEQRASLQELNELKNKLLGMAAHDLRNPLGAILGFSQILLDERADLSEEDLDECLVNINESSKNLLGLINELLDVSVIESGRVDLKIQAADMRKLIEGRLKINRILAENKNITLHADLVDTGSVLVDPNRISQVIDNLLSNAIKFSPSGKNIHVKSGKKKEFAVVSVQDEGPGISAEDRDKLFKEFQKLSARPTGGEVSTGLGLSIAKKIVDLHEGVIDVKSETGKGSTFWFTVPLAQ